MLISQLSLETHSINGGPGCKCRVEIGIWRIHVLITQLSFEWQGWALLSSLLKPTTCIEIADAIQRLWLALRLLTMLISQFFLETHSINGGRGGEFRGEVDSLLSSLLRGEDWHYLALR
jgi:hypothetical protein